MTAAVWHLDVSSTSRTPLGQASPALAVFQTEAHIGHVGLFWHPSSCLSNQRTFFGHKQSSSSISSLWLGLSQRGAVSGGILLPGTGPSAAWEACSHPNRACVCVCVITMWENAGRIGRRLLWQDRLEARRQRPITLAAAPVKELFDFVWTG